MICRKYTTFVVEIRKDYREACTAFRVDSDYVPIFESKFVSKLVIRCALMFDIFSTSSFTLIPLCIPFDFFQTTFHNFFDFCIK